MRKTGFYLIAIIFILFQGTLNAQDTIHKKGIHIVEKDSATLFGGKSAVEKASEEATLLIGGYVCTYFAMYSEDTPNHGFATVPVMAPRDRQIGLNMAMMSMQYNSKNVRGNVAFHFGDIPQAVWPADFNMIQEANGGCRLFKNLWLDAGFFRSHIGVESTQPRENITSSMSMVDNYEPYYLGGAKLTYVVSSKLSLQINSFNSFNTFVDYNKNKLLGFSAIIDPSDKVSVSYNFLTGDESADTATLKQRRYYNNIYATFKLGKLVLAAEANYGWQEHSVLKDTNASATIISGLIVARYQFAKKVSVYTRGEYFSDPERVLTGSLDFGKNIMGTTLGMEYKPYKNVSLNVEGRILQSDNYVFKEGNFHTNQRYELITCLDISF